MTGFFEMVGYTVTCGAILIGIFAVCGAIVYGLVTAANHKRK